MKPKKKIFPTITLLGTKVNLLSPKEVIENIKEQLTKEKSSYIITLNPEMVVRAQKDVHFLRIINNAALVVPDGIGVLVAAKIISWKQKNFFKSWERVTGVDLIYQLAQEIKEAKFFLFGALPGIAEKTGKVLKKLYPHAQIKGSEPGYNFLTRDVIEKINRLQPNILLVALGSPYQEKWIAKHLNQMPSVKVAIGVGGAFDFISGKTKRAPRWLRKIGLEWLWRGIREPWRVKRIFNATIVFPYLFFKKEIF